MSSRIHPFMETSLANHVLEPVVETAKVQVYKMFRPGSRAYLVQISFTPEGIAIQGDIGFGANQGGVCSTGGYGRGWFAKPLAEGYLAEKFLARAWHADLALEEVADWLDLDSDVSHGEGLRELAEKLKSGGIDNEYDLYQFISTELPDYLDQIPGYGRDPGETGWLAAVHKRFVQLWNDRVTA